MWPANQSARPAWRASEGALEPRIYTRGVLFDICSLPPGICCFLVIKGGRSGVIARVDEAYGNARTRASGKSFLRTLLRHPTCVLFEAIRLELDKLSSILLFCCCAPKTHATTVICSADLQMTVVACFWFGSQFCAPSHRLVEC